MHPIERLRYVARASGADQGLLVGETARALAAFDGDLGGLVAAARRVIERHPTSGPLWWLCSRVLTAPDGLRDAWAAVSELEGDGTAVELAHALPDAATVCVVGWPELTGEALPRRGDVEVLVVDALGEGSGLVRRLAQSGVDAVDVPVTGLGAAVSESDLVVIEAVAVGPTGLLATSGSLAAAAVAHQRGVPVWLVAGVGRLLPERTWEAVVARLDAPGDDPWERDEEQVTLDLVDQVCGPGGLVALEEALKQVDCPVAPELFGGGLAPGTYRAGGLDPGW